MSIWSLCRSQLRGNSFARALISLTLIPIGCLVLITIASLQMNGTWEPSPASAGNGVNNGGNAVGGGSRPNRMGNGAGRQDQQRSSEDSWVGRPLQPNIPHPLQRGFDHTDEQPWLSLDDTLDDLRGYAGSGNKALAGRRICFVTAGLAGPILYGGIGQAVLRQALLYADNGADVDIAYAGAFQAGDPAFWASHFAPMGLHFHFVPKNDVRYLYGTLHMKRAYDVWRWLQEKDGSNPYDLIVFHDLRGLGIYVMYAKASGLAFARTAMMVHAHGSARLSDYFNARLPGDGDAGLVLYAMERVSVELADFVLSPSEFYYSWMRSNGYQLSSSLSPQRSKLWTISLLVPSDESGTFDNQRRYGQKVLSTKFGFFGRIDRLKGVITLLDALDHLVESRDAILPTEILFAGDPANIRVDGKPINSMAYITQRQQAANWPFNIRFVSNFTSNQVANLFVKENYIFVNPTNGETASTVTVELLSAGVAMITTNVCAIPELFGDHDMFEQWQFERGDSIALSDLMRKAMRVGVPVNRPRVSARKAEDLYVAAAVGSILLSRANEKAAEQLEVPLSLTIGVATRDRADLLAELMQSLVAQSVFPKDTEIVVLDVGSQNASSVADVVGKYEPALRTRGVRVVFRRRDTRAHVSVARNIIMEVASGSHILLIDDDDIALPRMVELLCATARRTQADVVSGFAQNFEDLDGQRIVRRISLSSGASHESMAFVHHAGKSNMLVRKSAMVAVGGCSVDLNSSPTPFVDWDLYVKLAAAGATMAVVPEPTFMYRMSSRQSIYYGAVGRDDLMFYAHAKRAAGLCSVYNIPSHVCTGLAISLQLLSRPGGISPLPVGH